MMRLVADENFSGDIVRGLLARLPALDLVRVQDAGMMNTPDPDVLAWAAAHGRVVLTHDKETVPHYAYDRVRAGQAMPGVIAVAALTPVGRAIEDLATLLVCSLDDELREQVAYIPL